MSVLPPYNQPDFLTGALNTLKDFGSGVGDFLFGAGHGPGALDPSRNYNFNPMTPEETTAALPSADSLFGRIGQGFANLGNQPVANDPGLIGSVARVANQAFGQDVKVGDVGAAFAPPTDFSNPLFALGPEGNFAGNIGEALAPIARMAVNKAGAFLAGRGAEAAQAPASNLERMIAAGGDFSKVSPAERAAEQAKADAGVVSVNQKATNDLLKQGIAERQGVIASRIAELEQQGLTSQQAFNAAQHQFGPQAAIKFATTGEDILVESKIPMARASAPAVDKPNLGVNLDKIAAPQATKDYIEQVAKTNDGFVEQRRGVQTISETQAKADALSIDAQKFAYIKPGTAMNAEQLRGTFDAMVTKGNEVTSLQEALRAERAAGISSKTTELRLLGAAAEHQTLQRVYAGVRAESGRALRVQREISQGLRAGDVNATYSRAVELLGGKDTADAMLGRLQDIWTDPKLSPADREVAVYRFVQHMDEATTADKVTEVWTNAVLSAPPTHVANIVGQTALTIADMGTNFVTAAVEALSTGFGLRRPREYTFSAAFGSFASLGRGFRQAVMNLRDAESVAATKFRETGYMNRQAIGGKVGAVINVPTNLLGAEDAVFSGFGQARGLYEGAYNTAAKENIRPFSKKFADRVAELINNPTPEILDHMTEMGKRAGLRQSPDRVTRAIIRLRSEVEIPVIGVKPLKFVIPFVATPMNILKVGGEYFPTGFVRAIGLTGAERSEAIARAALGSVAMGYFAEQFTAGNITAGAPTNPAEKDAFYAQGKIPYAARIGGNWVAFDRFEPVSTPLKWTAVLMQSAKDSHDAGDSLSLTATKMVFGLGKQFTDSSYLSSLSDVIDAMSDPSKAPKVLENIVSGFNPAIVRRAVQASDPYIRDPKDIFQQIAATLPYLNETVPVKQTAFGEPATRSEGKQGVSGFLSPYDYNPEHLDQLLQKVSSYQLPESIGPDGQLLPVRGLTVGLVSQDIATFSLNAAEGQRYQQYAGQATRNLLTQLFADQILYDDKKFSTLEYADQIRAIRKTVTDARDVGRAQVADEIVAAATNDGQTARGAIMRLSTISKLRDEARYVEGLQRTGQMTAGAAQLIDQRRAKDKPTVAEYVRWAPIIDEYVNLPAYRIGDATEWAQLRKVRNLADAYASDTNKPANVETWRWYAQIDPEGANLIRKYARTALRDPRRLQMLRQNPGLDQFVSGA